MKKGFPTSFMRGKQAHDKCSKSFTPTLVMLAAAGIRGGTFGPAFCGPGSSL